jgi:hypothetical protein
MVGSTAREFSIGVGRKGTPQKDDPLEQYRLTAKRTIERGVDISKGGISDFTLVNDSASTYEVHYSSQ